MNAGIIVTTREVFYAPTKRRTYLSARSAANGEATARLNQKYPTEAAEYENGMMYYPGWNWQEDERLVRVHRRLARLLQKQLRAARAVKGDRT